MRVEKWDKMMYYLLREKRTKNQVKKIVEQSTREKRAVCILAFGPDGKILAVSRKNDPTAFGLPGGKVDPGEDDETAAERELMEETGLSTVSMKRIFTGKDGPFTVTTFLAKLAGDINTDEAGVVKYVDPSVVIDGPFAEYNTELFQRVEELGLMKESLNSKRTPKSDARSGKSKNSKPDYLDLDKDGDTSEPMKKAAKESDDKKETKPKKGKGKIPAQLKMHIKKKKSKLDETIAYLEKILIENMDEDFEDDMPSYDEEDFGDYGEESMRKFAQKSKDFADKYTEEEDYEDEEDEEYLTEAEVKKKKPRLGKVTRNPSGSNKKFHVYVKCGGKVKKISFGDPGLSIKRDSPARRKNFRARHKCDKPAGKDRCTARYWSCYQWRSGKKVEGE